MERFGFLHSAYSRQDCFVAVISLLVSFGEGVECLLPGVITQYVSCDIGVDGLQEQFLANVFFFTLAFGVLLGGTIADRIGEKKSLLTSLYLSCMTTVACAVVANYWTLFLSRALIGFCIGLAFIDSVFTAKFASSRVKDMLIFLGYFGHDVGGTYTGILGYFLLDYLGWRKFLLSASLPIFLPPLILLHYKFTSNVDDESNQLIKAVADEEIVQKDRKCTPYLKIVQLACFQFAIMHTGRGTVLLLPSLIQAFHINQAVQDTDPCNNITDGSDFLIVAAVAFFSVIGRSAGYKCRKSPNFRAFMVLPSVLLVMSYTVMLLKNSLMIIVISSMVAKFTYAHCSMISGFIFLNERYFKHTGLSLTMGSTIIMTVGAFGSFAGSTVAAFASANVAVAVALGMSCVVLAIVALMPGTFQIEEY